MFNIKDHKWRFNFYCTKKIWFIHVKEINYPFVLIEKTISGHHAEMCMSEAHNVSLVFDKNLQFVINESMKSLLVETEVFTYKQVYGEP